VSAPLRIESLGAEAGGLEAFDRVRDEIGIYAGTGPEGVTPGVACVLAWRGSTPVARASIQIARDLHDAPGATGMIGHYEASEAEAGTAVLVSACRALAAQGADRVVGPMNGSTWARYRLALRGPAEGPQADPGVEAGDPPPFLTEPWNPARYSDDFSAAGFSIEARYESRVDERLDREADDAAERDAGVRAAGIRVRPLDLSRFDAELDALYAMSLASFGANLYYGPIASEAFRAQYQKARPLIDPELVLIAEDARGAPIGFQFAFVDPLSPAGLPPRAVVKTVATVPAARGKGLADHLLDRLRRRAHTLGCGSAIHALIHVKNVSMRMSSRHESRLFRRYALYRWTP